MDDFWGDWNEDIADADNTTDWGAPEQYAPVADNYYEDVTPVYYPDPPAYQPPAEPQYDPSFYQSQGFGGFIDFANLWNNSAPPPPNSAAPSLTWNDIFNFSVGAIDGAGTPAPDDYFGNIGNAISQPWEGLEQKTQGKDWWDIGAVWDTGNALAGSALGAMGETFKPIGGAVDAAADANIPVVSGLAQGTRFGYEQIAEPIFNTTAGLIGTLAGSTQYTGDEGSLAGFRFDRNFASRGYEANDPDKVYNETFNSLIAQGKTPDEARKRAEREREKMYNPLNRAFAQGVEETSEMPAIAQLGIGLFDPIGNKFGDYAISGTPLKYGGRLPGVKTLDEPITITNPLAPLPLAAKAVGAATDLPGIKQIKEGAGRVAGNIAERLQSPQQLASQFEREIQTAAPLIEQIAARESITPLEAIEQITGTPDSPYYYTNIGITPEIAGTLQTIAEQVRIADGTAIARDAANPNLQTLATEVDPALARLTAQQYAPADMSLERAGQIYDTIGLPVEQIDPNIRPVVPKSGYAPPSEGAKLFDELFPQSAGRNPTAPAAPIIKSRYTGEGRGVPGEGELKAIKANRLNVASELDDYLTSAKNLYGLQSKALKLSGKVESPQLRATAPLEQFGAASLPFRALGKTMPFFSRAYLNTLSRAVRDPLSNVAKLTIGGDAGALLNRKKINARYSQLFGDNVPDVISGGGMLQDITGTGAIIDPTKKVRGGAEAVADTERATTAAFFLAINPFNEATSKVLKKVTGGRFKDWNDVAEKAEGVIKTSLYKQRAVQAYDSAVRTAVKNGDIPAELQAAFKSGSVAPEALQAFITGQLPRGADLGQAMRGEYNPLNFGASSPSPETPTPALNNPMVERVLSGQGGPVGSILMAKLDTLVDRVEQYNAGRIERARTLAGIDKIKDPKRRASAERSMNANLGLAKLDEINPDHPLFKELEAEIKSDLDTYYDINVEMEAGRSDVQEATRALIEQSLQYVAADKTLATAKSWLAQQIERSEGRYSTRYKKSEYDIGEERKAEARRVQEEATAKREVARQEAQAIRALPFAYVRNARNKYPGITNKELLTRWEESQAARAAKVNKGKVAETVPTEQSQAATAAAVQNVRASDAPTQQFNLNQIELDPTRFQYKAGADEATGSVKSLAGVDVWRPDLAGVISVWRDPANGKTYIINGHNRFDLAKRAKNKPAKVEVRFLPAKTASEARALGAEINIAEGQGTALDAAQYFRETGATPDDLKAKGLNITRGKAQDGVSLAALNDNLWAAVKQGYLPEEQAVQIGARVKDPAVQQAVFSIIKRDGRFKKLNREQFIELVETAKVDETVRRLGTQSTFDDAAALTELEQRIKIASQLTGELNKEYSAFNSAAKNAETLRGAGSSIDVAQATERAAAARRAKERFSEFKNTPLFRSIIGKYAYEAAQLPDAQRAAVYDRARAEIRQTLELDDASFIRAVQEYQSAAPAPTSPTPAPDAGQLSMFDEQPTNTPAPEATVSDIARQQVESGQMDMFGMYDESPPLATSNVGTEQGAGGAGQPDLTPERLKYYVNEIYRNSPVETPQKIRELMQRIMSDKPLSAQQKKTYMRNVMETDEHIRAVTGNTFKLDLEAFTPVRISDNVSLAELNGQPRPAPMGAARPTLTTPEGLELPRPVDLDETIDTIEQLLGNNAYKDFSQMNPAERDLAISQVAKAMGFPDPHAPDVVRERLDIERAEAMKALDAIKSDMTARYKEQKLNRTLVGDLEQKIEAQKEARAADDQALADTIYAYRQRLAMEAQREAYNAVANTFFDYSQKNVIDQALGTLIPFNYWARKNFVYLAKYFAKHPMHLAALLNFYSNLEEENKENGLPGYARGNIYLWQNPDGSKVLWNFNSLLPFNPLGDTESLMKVIGADEDGNAANPTGLGELLFGYDKKNAKGEVTGREKGIFPSFFRPNPVIDIATKTGKPNEIMKSLGLVTDGFGSPDPSAKRGERMTAGLIPGRYFYQEIGAATGITKALREQGIIKADLDPEGFLNEILFGRNAGKPLTKIEQELASMTQSGEINADKAMLAIAAIKEGNWTPEALAALDRVQGENAGRRLLSQIGFQSVVTNTPRSELANKLYQGMGAVGGDAGKGRYEVDPATGKKTYIEGAAAKFYRDNPGAGVLASKNDSAANIRQGLADDQTRAAMNNLYTKQREKKISARDFNLAVEKLSGQNPAYFEKYPLKQDAGDRRYSEQYDQYNQIGGAKYDALSEQVATLMKGTAEDKKAAYAIMNSREYKNAQAARDQFLKDNPDFFNRYKEGIEKKSGKPYTVKSDADKTYSEKQTAYYAIGGAKYEEMNKRQQELRAAGKTKEANAITNSAEYKRVKAAREQFLIDNQDFNDRLHREQEEKYGDKPQQTKSPNKSSSSSKSYSTAKTGSGKSSAPAKRTYTQSSGARKTTSTYTRPSQPAKRPVQNNLYAGKQTARVSANRAPIRQQPRMGYSGRTTTGRITNNLPAPTNVKYNKSGRRILTDKELRKVLQSGIDPNEFLNYTSNRDIGEVIALNKRAVNSLPKPSALANTISKPTSKGKKPKWKKTPPRR